MAHAFGYLSARRLASALLLLGLAILLGVPARLSAQPGVTVVRFTVFSAKPIADIGFVPKLNAPPQKLQFQPTARSVRYEYRGTMPLRFVDVTTGAVMAEATIPPNVRDALLLFAPIEAATPTPTPTPAPTEGPGKSKGKDTKWSGNSSGGGLRYQISVLDDSGLRHAPGGVSIINLSGLALTGTVNNEKVTLKPGLNPTVSIGAAKTAKITLTTVFKNKTYQSYAGAATLGRNDRALLILFPPFYPGALEVQSRLLIDQPPGTATPAPKR